MERWTNYLRGQSPFAFNDPAGRTAGQCTSQRSPIHGLDDGSAALYPIAAIEVVDTAEGMVASMMNVAAHRRDHAAYTEEALNAALEVAIRTNSRGRNAIGTNSAGD
jgi:hypothetical protein